MVGTLPDMATEQPRRGRPPGRTPTHTIHTAIDPEIGAALLQYMKAQPYMPKLRHVVERAFTSFLAAQGFWPGGEERKKRK